MIREKELYHHGVLGQKWGVRRTLAQLGHPVQAHKARKVKKQRAAALEKARATRKAKAEYEAGKQKALKSGNANDVLKYKGDLTNDQMQSAINRITLENNLSNLRTSPKASTGSKFMKSAKDIVSSPAKDVGKQLVKSGLVYLADEKLLPGIAKQMKYTAGTDEYKDFIDTYKVYTNNKKKS